MKNKAATSIFSWVLSFLFLLPSPGFAAAKTESIASVDERDRLQLAIPYEPDGIPETVPEEPGVRNTLRSTTAHFETSPLTPVERPADQVKKIVLKAPSRDPVEKKEPSEEVDRGVGEFLDRLFLKIYQEEAAKQGAEALKNQDPVKFISDYLNNPENLKTLMNNVKTLLESPENGKEISPELKARLQELIPGPGADGITPLDLEALRKSYEAHIKEFIDADRNKVFGGTDSQITNSVNPGTIESTGARNPAFVAPVVNPQENPAGNPAARSQPYWGRILENLGEEALSQPFDHAKQILASDGVKERNAAAAPQKDMRGKYKIVDSVYVGTDFLRVQKMASPPKDLHPYLKWVLYERNISPESLSRYVKTREKMNELYKLAKGGRGKIRYKGKIYESFMPEFFQGAGNFELVQMIKGS